MHPPTLASSVARSRHQSPRKRQATWVKWSSRPIDRGERIKVASGHNIHEERPELVIDAILDVLAP